MNGIRLLAETVRWWFRATQIDEMASVTVRITRYVKILERHIQSGSLFEKISSLIVIFLWVTASIIWSFLYYPFCVFSRWRQGREKTKNILFVSHDGTLSGAPQSLISILERLDREEFHPIVICGSEGPFTEETKILSVPTVVLPLSFMFWEYRNIKFLYQFVRLFICLPFLFYILTNFSLRAVHINSLVTPDVAIASRLLAGKTAWYIREPSLDTRWGRLRMSIVAALSHTIIANSKFTEAKILSSRKTNRRVSLIYNFLKKGFVQSSAHRDEIRQSLGVASDDFVIGCVGRVCSDKGQDILVRAAVDVAKAYPTAHFLLIGSEDDAAFVGGLRQTIEASHLSARIRFTGVRDDVASIMPALDVHVTPSRWEEPFGRVAMEAMASGAVSVVSNRGGLPEIVEDGRSGLVFAAEDEIALAAKIKSLIDDPQLRHNLSQAGMRRAETVFSGDSQMGELHKIYRALLA